MHGQTSRRMHAIRHALLHACVNNHTHTVSHYRFPYIEDLLWRLPRQCMHQNSGQPLADGTVTVGTQLHSPLVINPGGQPHLCCTAHDAVVRDAVFRCKGRQGLGIPKQKTGLVLCGSQRCLCLCILCIPLHSIPSASLGLTAGNNQAANTRNTCALLTLPRSAASCSKVMPGRLNVGDAACGGACNKQSPSSSKLVTMQRMHASPCASHTPHQQQPACVQDGQRVLSLYKGEAT